MISLYSKLSETQRTVYFSFTEENACWRFTAMTVCFSVLARFMTLRYEYKEYQSAKQEAPQPILTDWESSSISAKTGSQHGDRLCDMFHFLFIYWDFTWEALPWAKFRSSCTTESSFYILTFSKQFLNYTQQTSHWCTTRLWQNTNRCITEFLYTSQNLCVARFSL